PEVRHGAGRRRWCEGEQPHTLSWRSAAADDAEWMSGKSRDRLALLVLTEASSWMSDRRAQGSPRERALGDQVLREGVGQLPVRYGAARGGQEGHIAACPFLRSVMRCSFRSLKRIRYNCRTPARFDP